MKTVQTKERLTSTIDLRVARIDGAKTPTLKRFYKKIANRLDFPKYFGKNLDSLADMLCDLSWLQESHVLVYIKNPDAFLKDEKKSKKNAVLEIFAEAASNQIEEAVRLELFIQELFRLVYLMLFLLQLYL